ITARLQIGNPIDRVELKRLLKVGGLRSGGAVGGAGICRSKQEIALSGSEQHARKEVRMQNAAIVAGQGSQLAVLIGRGSERGKGRRQPTSSRRRHTFPALWELLHARDSAEIGV